MEETIISLLNNTNIPGIEKLINWMKINGYFTSPCSGQHHLSKEGGLAEHSLNVFEYMCCFWKATNSKIDFNSIVITSLLHDLGKAGQYGKPNYVENMISDRKGGFKQSENKPYVTNPLLLSVPHEVRSIHIASQFIQLTEEENWAILMHNGMYGEFKYTLQGKETPLYLLLHFADMWCSRVVEKSNEEVEE
ncbi:HD domain-containing protein [Anaerocolumna chitinilytica]|uniref:HD family phosphohydrolase n=1 Tax=Anaerocolumna chitinilytica TaxID=1727145 RepID=A0A7M3SAL6_9FIRM|nr:HD family phosphohydrolase [Anaerocolumna chitinilytica]BCK01634.1 HD family phosphohydrolase [Anaerocolumna chitinilytica]